MESSQPWTLIIIEEACYVLFLYDPFTFRTACRRYNLVAGLSSSLGWRHKFIRIQLDHLAHPGDYLPTLDNIILSHSISGRVGLVGMGHPHPGCLY